MKRAIPFFSLLVSVLLVNAQMTVRVMQYNILDFPEPVPAGRADTLARIIAYHPVDLLIGEELRTEAGADSVLTRALNTGGVTRFSMAAWEPLHSDPGATYSLQQIIWYDHDLLGLKEQGYLLTNIRDLNWYTLYLRTPDLAFTNDTTFLTVFAVHLKAGSATSDASERDAMAQVLVDHLSTLPPDRHVIVAGDMNFYTGSEAGFQTLTSTGNAIHLQDPIDQVGAWNNNASYAPIHTQSTRTSAIYGAGAGGGLDDRFDIALMSAGLLDANSPLHFTIGSHHPLGNSGTCFNQNVTDCDPGITPASVLNSLYYMSDHLPAVFELGFDPLLSVEPIAAASGQVLEVVQDGDHWIAVVQPFNGAVGVLRVLDPLGRVVRTNEVHGAVEQRIPLVDLPGGTYLLSLSNSTGARTIKWTALPRP